MLRVCFGLLGVISVMLGIFLNRIRIDGPVQLMIVTGGGDNVFLYNEVSGNFISVTEEWDSQYFTGSKSSGAKRDFIPVPDGTLIVGYDTTATLMSNIFFRFDLKTGKVTPLLPDNPYSLGHGLSPDNEWLVISYHGSIYRQKVGFDTAELLMEGQSLAFHGWLSDGQTIIVEDRDAESGLFLIDIHNRNIKPVETIGRVTWVHASPDPDWFTVMEMVNGQQVTYGVNFITGDRKRLLPVNQSTWYTIVGFDDESESLLYLDRDYGGTRKLRRLHPNGIAETLFSDVSSFKWLSEHMLLVATNTFSPYIEIMFLSTETWQSQRVDTVFSQYYKVGGCLPNGCFIFSENEVIFVKVDGTYSDTLSRLPGYVKEFYGQSPYDNWYIVEGEEWNGRSYVSRLRPDGKEVQPFFPQGTTFGRIHGWLPFRNYDWHAWWWLIGGGVLLLIGVRGLRSRRRARSDLLP